MTEDSRPATWAHIHEVQMKMHQIITDLTNRATFHDQSKLIDPEKAIFDEYSPKLKATTYDSQEYRDHLSMMKLALTHHYTKNDHHPEHFVGVDGGTISKNYPRSGQVQGNVPIRRDAGVHGMNLIQMMEMLADWKAATMRHADGDLRTSIEKNAERFGYGQEIHDLLLHTAAYLGWL